MTSITVPEAVLALLRKAEGTTVIRDASGTVVGFYEPANRMQSADLTASDEVLAIFRQTRGPVELHDATGNVVGYYISVPPDRAKFVANAFPPPDPARPEADPLEDLRADFDLEAMERQQDVNEKGYTLAEVYEHLLDITPGPESRAILQNSIARLRERDRCDTPHIFP